MPPRPRRSLARVTVAAVIVALTASPTAAQDAGFTARMNLVIDGHEDVPIVAHLFTPDNASVDTPVPVVLRTHGWGGRGETEVAGTTARLLDEGFAVLTWDSRGFGFSGGEVTVDKPGLEGQDVTALIDWLTGNDLTGVPNMPELLYDDGDPVVGMSGYSYAGGIQTATAAVDDRIDAIAPEISWASLPDALYEGRVANLGWASGLYGLGKQTASQEGLDPTNPAGPQAGGLDPAIDQAYSEITGQTVLSEQSLDFFKGSSLTDYTAATGDIAVPALVMTGSVDTLFDVTGGHEIYEHISDAGADAKHIVFCGGHNDCPAFYTAIDDRAYLDDAIVDWFDKYLLGEDVDTGPSFEYRTNDGVWRTADSFSPADRDRVDVTGEGTVVQNPAPATDPSADGTGVFTAFPNASDQTGFGVEVLEGTDGPVEVLGIPDFRLTVAGTGDHAHLFVKLVHREAGHVLNWQEASWRFDDIGDAQTADLRMAGLAYSIPEGDHLDVQVSTVSAMHQMARVPAQLDVTVEASVPVLSAPAAAPQPTPTTTPTADPSPSDGGTAAPDTDVDPGTAAPRTPSTGGGAAILALGSLGAAAVLRRRRVS